MSVLKTIGQGEQKNLFIKISRWGKRKKSLRFGSFIGFIVPTFDTKVTEYLCSGWVFFLQTNFDFLTSLF